MGMIWQECCELHDGEKGKVAHVGRKSPCMVTGWHLRGWWQQLCGRTPGDTARQQASCITLWAVGWGKQHSPLLNIYWITSRCCVQLWASCCGNGSWSKFSRGQQPAEPGFAQWPMVGGQKTGGINCNKRGSDWLEGKTWWWWEESGSGAAVSALCPQRLSRPGQTKPTATLVSPCSRLKSTRGPFHPELP